MAKRKPTRKQKAAPKMSKEDRLQLQEKTLKAIAPLAKRANAALDKASVADGRANDLRLTAAVELGTAKTKCAEAGINFKAWCGENVIQSYETVRKLATIGQSDDPAAALADLRDRTKKAQAKNRKDATKANPLKADISKVIEAMPEKKAVALIGKHAGNYGLELVAAVDGDPMARMQSLFSEMKKSQQYKFIAWAAEQVGGEATIDGVPLSV